MWLWHQFQVDPLLLCFFCGPTAVTFAAARPALGPAVPVALRVPS